MDDCLSPPTTSSNMECTARLSRLQSVRRRRWASSECGNAEYRSPNLFYLTYPPSRDSRRSLPTDEWRRIKTLQEADQIAKSARANKSTSAIERGKRSWRKRQQKTKSGTENTRVSVPKNSLETSESPVRDSGTTGSGGKTEPLSIFRGREHRDQPSSPSTMREGYGE